MRRLRLAARLIAPVLLGAGVLSLGYAAYVVIDAKAYQSTERQRFEDHTQPKMSAAPASAGQAIAQIESRRVGLLAVVAEGDSPAVLQRAVGHLAATAWPGEAGNVVLAGHRDTFFRPLRGIRVGDAITLKTGSGDFEYLVESIAVVAPSDIDVIKPTSRRTLTLITCFPFSYIGPAPDRFIVRARDITAPH